MEVDVAGERLRVAEGNQDYEATITKMCQCDWHCESLISGPERHHIMTLQLIWSISFSTALKRSYYENILFSFEIMMHHTIYIFFLMKCIENLLI